jgi:hypothetical protein
MAHVDEGSTRGRKVGVQSNKRKGTSQACDEHAGRRTVFYSLDQEAHTCSLGDGGSTGYDKVSFSCPSSQKLEFIRPLTSDQLRLLLTLPPATRRKIASIGRVLRSLMCFFFQLEGKPVGMINALRDGEAV